MRHLGVTSAARKRVLILISDTGGGHRASAQALASVIEQSHGHHVETTIVDVWTAYGPWPFNRMVRQYRYMQRRPALWYAMYKTSAFAPTRALLTSLQSWTARRGFAACIREHQPDMVISMHPLCQTVPLQVLVAGGARPPLRKSLAASTGADGRLRSAAAAIAASPTDAAAEAAEAHSRASDGTGPPPPLADAARLEAGGGTSRKPILFATVVTDLGAAHPLWFHPGADLVFVPTEQFGRSARAAGLAPSQIRTYGLPVRPTFTRLADSSASAKRKRAARRALGLREDVPTVLIVGGGDGVGRLRLIVEEVASTLGRAGFEAQVVVVCGRNQQLQAELRERAWPRNLDVFVEGFVSRMADFMAAADCLVTKAGPGTIAEASICGLPVMLSGHLPGQETGNVKHVLRSGFGAYSRKPRVIANTVTRWLREPETRARLATRARAAARPFATKAIAQDVIELLYSVPRSSASAVAVPAL